MDYDEPLQTECSVSGLLSVVLHVSRAVGMAPLKFDRLNNGWRIRVSRINSWCGQAVVIVLTILSMVALIEELKNAEKTPSRTHANAFPIVAISKFFTMCIAVNVGAYIGFTRMQCSINCLSQLNQITKELNSYCQSSANDKNTWFTVVMSVVFVSSILIYGYFFYYMFLMREFILILYSSFEILSIQLLVLVLQFSVISMCVVPALQQLNGCLHGVSLTINKTTVSSLESLHSNSSVVKKRLGKKQFRDENYKLVKQLIQVNPKRVEINVDLKSSAVLRRLAFLYSSLCDIIRQIDTSSGCMLVVMPLTLMLQLIVTNYYLISGWLNPERIISLIMVLLGCLKALWHFGLLVLLVEPCHQTYEQMKQTKELIQKMMFSISPDDLGIISNLNLFYQQLMLNQVNYSPLRLFTLNRTLLITIISSMTTYLVILIQM